MKKNFIFVGIIVSIALASCANKERNFDLDASVKRLQENGWTIDGEIKDKEGLEKTTYYMTQFYINEGIDLYVQTIEYYLSLCGPGTLPPEDPNWTAPYEIEFIIFSSTQDANKYYSYFVDKSEKAKQVEGHQLRGIYLGINEKTYIQTNSKEASELVDGIDFYTI